MKTRLNLTIEEDLLDKAKKYAADNDVSVSELVENYFLKIVQKKKKPAFMEILENFQPGKTYKNRDLKKEYFEHKGRKI